MSDDSKVAAVGGDEGHLPHHQWHEDRQAREPPMDKPCPRLPGEGLRRHRWNIGRVGSIPIDAARPWIAFDGLTGGCTSKDRQMHPRCGARPPGPKDGTGASSRQSSILTAHLWPQCWQVANKPRTPYRRLPPSLTALGGWRATRCARCTCEQ